MNNVKAVIFDLDNTILDRSKTFRNFAASFVQTYFGHLETTDGLTERIIELDQDGYRPDECVYVGDHPRNDIEGAGKSGMRTVWIKVNQPWIPELTVRPHHKIERLPELLALL